MTHTEYIACVPREHVQTFGLPEQGFKADPNYKMYNNIEAHLTFGQRFLLEEDPNHKQIIPYLILTKDDAIWTMVRKKAGGESRLHHKASIGVGGHLEHQDDAESIIVTGLLRELHEEVYVSHEWDDKIEYIGLINDDTNAVGQVHLGMVFRLNLPHHAQVSIAETDKMTGTWRQIVQCTDLHCVQRDGLEFETWSQIVLDALFVK